ncbi:MAG: ABC transporter ATP-binding protein [Acutalibacteraceae bacterium]
MKRLLKKLDNISIKEILREVNWVWQYIKEYKFYVILYVVLGLVSTATGLIGSVLSKKLINCVTGYDHSSVLKVGIFYVLFGLATIFLNAVLSRLSAVSCAMVTQNIRTDVFSKVMNAKWQKFSEFHSGDILNRVNNDVATVATSVLTWLPNLVTKLFQFVGAFFIIFRYDKSMAFIALAGSPVTVAVSLFFLEKLRENAKGVRKASSSLMSFLGETFRENSNIKAFDLTDDFKKRFNIVQSALTSSTLKQNSFSIISSTAVSLVGMLVSYACFGWSVYRLWAGAINFGTMVLFIQLTSVLSSAFGSLVSLVPNAVNSAVAAGRVMEITQLESESCDESKIMKFIGENSKSGVSVELRDVRFSYNQKTPVLGGFCAEVSPGEIIALSGHSGAGKTTVLRLLLGLVETSDGEAVLIGKDSGEELEISSSTRKAFTYVPQGHSLFSGTIRENLLMLRPDATDEEINSALKAACAYDFVYAMPEGLDSRLGEDNQGLSEGQAQRIAIARAILSESPIILLDEATSAIDKTAEKIILENITSFATKKTLIVTTHKQSVLDISDRVYEVGKI